MVKNIKKYKKSKKLLILGATVNQLPFVEIAKKRGYFTITLDNVPKNICHKFSDDSINISTVDKDLVLNFAKGENVDGVVTCASDLALPTTTYVCNKLKLPSISNESVLTTINKDLFRKFLIENNLKIPKYFVFSNTKDILKQIKSLKDKWIIKPADSSGSKGLYLIDLNNVKNNLIEIIDNAFTFSRSKKVILEEYITGKNCSVDGFINSRKIDILCITNKTLTPPPHLTPISHTLPSKLPLYIQRKIKNIINKILKILDIKTSPFDFDMIITKNGDVYLIEMSLRIGGNGIPRLIKYFNGYDIYESVISYALSEEIAINKENKRRLYTGVYLILSPETGKLSSIVPKEILIKKYKGYLKELVYDISIGDKVEKFTQGNHRLGHYVLQAKTEKLLNKLSNQIKNDFNIKIKSK